MPALGPLGQTIQVVDRSGKVVSTSRHLFDVFKIGRNAYNEKKKEVNSKRASEDSSSRALKRSGRAYTIDDVASAHSGRSRRPPHSHRPPQYTQEAPRPPQSPSMDNTHPTAVPFYEAYPEFAPPMAPRRHSEFHPREQAGHPYTAPAPYHSPGAAPPQPQWSYSAQPQMNQVVYPPRYTPPASPQEIQARAPLMRRNTTKPSRPRSERRGTDGVDMDLAYGDVPPDLLYPGSPSVVSSPEQDQVQLNGLIGRANLLLDEANCLKSGATATIAHLQKNPDAMAAVGLTLAEISNLVKKMSPGVLMNLKRASPAIFSLLAHPQFLIAAGVATGVTIIAFGGYKIVKRIQERREMEALGDEALLPVEDVSRIETWRRGIADVEARSVGTSVEGEFITPLARSLSRLNLAEEQRERDRSRKPRAKPPGSVSSSGRSERSHRSKRSSSEPRSPKSRMEGALGGKSTSGSGSGKASGGKSKKSAAKREAKPSPLRRLLLA